MSQKYPPLHLLNIFEAAARLQSFKAASDELYITPSAVSHQIKALEEHLGLELFQRKTRGVALNEAGKMYLQFVQRGLSSFEVGTKKLKDRFASPLLKISSFTTMAGNIIIPQLGAFKQAHPDIDLRIETGNHETDLRYDDIDLAIRVGKGSWPDMVSEKLFDLDIAVVCSPNFARTHDLEAFENVNQLPLIDLSYMDDIWQQWANAIGLTLTNQKRTLTFSDYDSSINAAAQGLGLALAMFPIENVNLAHNVLVTPFSEFIPFQRSLYAVYHKADANRHDIHCFINWLKQSPLLVNG